MNLQCRIELRGNYKAGSQIARVIGEDWCGRELYCAACNSERLSAAKTNAPAVDFVCPSCDQPFQLKCFKTWNQKKIVDAGYESMIRAIRSDRVPNLLVLQYSADWLVENLLLVPSGFFADTIIEKRHPLGPHARRAGWVGCNILLGRIPEDGKIAIVSNGCAAAANNVRYEFARARKLSEVPPSMRGWTLDVLTAIRMLGATDFSLQELYGLQSYLQQLHPRNQNVRAKIRQQLQVLRDLGILAFRTPGRYSLLG
jgi:type II restriction enzyme